MDEQPLRKRAAWRHQRRPVQGEKRAVPLSDQTEQGAQIDPQAPLGLSEWDSTQCVPAGAAEDLPAAAAQTGRTPSTALLLLRAPLDRRQRLL